MKRSFAAAALWALCAGAAVAASEGVTYPAGAASDTDDRVAAFYAGQCASFADQRGLTGSDRQDYIANCQANGPAIWPVGEEPSSSSSEE